MAKVKSAPLSKKASAWKKAYEDASGVQKIGAAYTISEEAKAQAGSRGQRAVTEALRDVLNGNRKEATQLFRLANAFNKNDIGKAKKGKLSLTHLMILTTVESKTDREKLFQRAIDKGWSTARLRREIPGKSGRDQKSRPTQDVKSIVRSIDELIRWLDRLDDDFVEGVQNVKPHDRDNTRDQIGQAMERLDSLEAKLPEARKGLKAAAQNIARAPQP